MRLWFDNIGLTYLAYAIKVFFSLFKVMRKFKLVRSEKTVIYFDIGSAGGPPLIYRLLIKMGLISYLGFDPDNSWMAKKKIVDRLFNLPTGDHICVALGDDNEDKTLFITKFKECSSVLKPDLSAIKNSKLKQLFKILREVPIRTQRLDQMIIKDEVVVPDILKIDVQGYELNVLRGLGEFIGKISAIEMEIRLRSIYENEPSFSEVNNFLYGHGFILLDIQRQGPFGDELLEANAFWAQIPETTRERNVYDIFRSINNIGSGDTAEDLNSIMGER